MKLIRKILTLVIAGMICFSVFGNSTNKTEADKSERREAAVESTVNVLEVIIDCLEGLNE